MLVAELPATSISFDAINAERGLWGGSGIPIAEWGRTHDIARERTGAAIRAGEVVVVDDTSSPRFLRDGWRALADGLGVSLVLVHVDTPVEVSLARQTANRVDPTRPDVADDVMREHIESFEPPTPDERPLRVTPNTDLDDAIPRLRRLLMAARGGAPTPGSDQGPR